MTKPAIGSLKDIEKFFNAYNNHDWDGMFSYMSEDCVWEASEKMSEGATEYYRLLDT